jgi:Pvc16 N-terminal domain
VHHDAMAGFQALDAAGLSIVALLNRRFGERDGGVGLAAMLANTRQLKTMALNNGQIIQQPSISVFCYRVSVDRETRPGWSAVANGDGIPRIPLRLHFLIGAFAATIEEELLWLGLSAQILEAESILTGPLLLPVPLPNGTTVNPWRSGDVLQVVSDDLAVDSMSEAFQSLNTDYRLQLPYLVRVICIDGVQEPVATPVGTVAARAIRTPT